METVRSSGKRRAYILTFDRDDLVNYSRFHERLIELEKVENWFHYLKSSYIIISSYSATQLNNDISKLVPKKRHLIVELNLKNRNGLLPMKAWSWLDRHAQELTDIGPNL